MTGLPAAAVTYIGLPISSGGAHSLGRLPRRVAYDRTIAFLQACTEPVGAPDYSFTVITVAGLTPPDPFFDRELRRRFGDYTVLPAARVDEALAFLDDIDPQPTDEYGIAPVWFRFTTMFRLLDPTTERALPGQNPERFHRVEYDRALGLGSSILTLSLHRQAVLSIDFCIPDATVEVLRRVVPWLQHNLPFKLSSKQWRAWHPTKSGSFRATRLTLPAGVGSA